MKSAFLSSQNQWNVSSFKASSEDVCSLRKIKIMNDMNDFIDLSIVLLIWLTWLIFRFLSMCLLKSFKRLISLKSSFSEMLKLISSNMSLSIVINLIFVSLSMFLSIDDLISNLRFREIRIIDLISKQCCRENWNVLIEIVWIDMNFRFENSHQTESSSPIRTSLMWVYCEFLMNSHQNHAKKNTCFVYNFAREKRYIE
jgi:hypothetical protein